MSIRKLLKRSSDTINQPGLGLSLIQLKIMLECVLCVQQPFVQGITAIHPLNKILLTSTLFYQPCGPSNTIRLNFYFPVLICLDGITQIVHVKFNCITVSFEMIQHGIYLNPDLINMVNYSISLALCL